MNITINKIGITDGEKSELYANVSLFLWSIGPHYSEEYIPSYQVSEGLFEESDTIPIYGKEIYCIYGGGFEFGVNYKAFIEEWNRK